MHSRISGHSDSELKENDLRSTDTSIEPATNIYDLREE